MKLKPAEIWARLNSTYWFVPVLMTFAAVAAVFGAILLDQRLVLEDGWLRFLYPSSLEGARALLSSATGSMITVVSVTFSVTAAALTVASQHFGPRLLDHFMRETGSKISSGADCRERRQVRHGLLFTATLPDGRECTCNATRFRHSSMPPSTLSASSPDRTRRSRRSERT